MTPQTCQISYVVRVTLLEKPRDGATRPTTICDTSQAVHVLLRRNMEIQSEKESVRFAFKQFQTQSGWTRRKGGQMQLAAEQPKPISLTLDTASTQAPESTINLDFSFEPTGRESSLPRFDRIRSRLKATTYYGTVPGDDIPCSSDPASTGTDREAYFTTIPLASHNLPSLEWEPSPSLRSEKWSEWSGYASGSESTLDLVDSFSQSCFKASSKIPIILPSDRNLVPTFHSCLVSRSYELELTFCYSMPQTFGSSTVSLRVPLELV